jgi:hypothetical protein
MRMMQMVANPIIGMGTALSPRLIAQPAAIERVDRRTKRRRNLSTGVVEAG